MTPSELPPTLDRLARELDAGFRREEARVRSARRKRRALAGILVVLVGTPTAVATRPLWDPAAENGGSGPIAAGSAPIVSRGVSGDEMWKLSLFYGTKDLCLRLTVLADGITPLVACSTAPHGKTLRPAYFQTPGHTYVFGRAPRVGRRVTVRLDGTDFSAPIVEPNGDALKGLRGSAAQNRVYVITIDRHGSFPEPPLVSVSD